MLLFFAGTSALAADIVYLRGSPERIAGHVGEIPDTWRPRILLIGDIAPGDDRRFASVLKQAAAQNANWANDRTLRLDSSGGHVATAMAIGRLVRKAQLTTIVQRGGTCASACVLVLAGGVWRIAGPGSRIGLHRPYFFDPNKATAKGYETFQRAYDSVVEAHRAYFSEMGIGNGLLEQMLKVPSNDVQWIDEESASRLNLLGEDATYAEWERAQRIAKKGIACVDYQDRRIQCVNAYLDNSRDVDAAWESCVAKLGAPPSNCD